MKFLITLPVIALISISQPANAQNYPSILKVQGEHRVYAVPEMMEVNIPLQVKDVSYEACSAQLVKTYNDLSASLVKAGIEKDLIKSSGLNIQEFYNYYERERKLEGYTGNIQIYIKLPHDDAKLQSIMRTLRDERFRFGYNLGFSLSEKQKETLEAEAIKSAIADARAKADAMAEALGMKLIAVQEVNYGYTEGRQDFLTREKVFMASRDMNESGDLQLNPQLQEVYRNVGVIWHIAK
jgi:uncharacterized protein YggE